MPPFFIYTTTDFLEHLIRISYSLTCVFVGAIRNFIKTDAVRIL
jgi:hypothetical protein